MDTSEFNTFVIEFNRENNEQDLNELRFHVVNTMKQATNFNESKVKKQLIKIGKIKAEEDSGKAQEAPSSPPQEEKKAEDKVAPKSPAKKASVKAVEVSEPEDDDAPFN